MSFNDYSHHIKLILDNPSLDHLDLLTAYYLGLKASTPDSPLLSSVETKVQALYVKKRGLKFLDRLLVISGSNNLTPETKEKIISSEESPNIIASVNIIAGKPEANTKIFAYKDRLLDPKFHEEFLAYESEAHHGVVSALIDRLELIVDKMSRGLQEAPSSKKNTLKNLYHGGNVGKGFISIDLRQANWSALRYWDKSLPRWEDFLEETLPSSEDFKALFKDSKNFRQVTLGVALKKHGAVKLVEATQVKIIRDATRNIIKRLGQPFSESNDEMIFEWHQRLHSPLERWVTSELDSSLFRLTRFRMLEKTHDECYVVEYHELDTDRKYTLLRCSSPEKVESRLNQ